MKPKIIIICGPTGVGKTAVALKLSQKFKGEIIGADSMQVYRLMDIGTAKPTQTQQAAVPHHLIDVVFPDEPFDAASFAEMADNIINSLIPRGVLPFIVGGTGLYIKALMHGLFRTRPATREVLKQLKNEAEKHGSDNLHHRLSIYDPKTAEKIHPNDTFRIIRALEIFEVTGKPISSFHDEHQFSNNKYWALKICIHSDRKKLYEHINQRVDEMMKNGFLNEVNMLLKKGYAPELKSMQSLGYRHMVEFISGKISWEEALDHMKRDTRRYAKRQLTWFKADQEMKWFTPDQIEQMQDEIDRFLR
jgi:tRNA dimethylallyltransferase